MSRARILAALVAAGALATAGFVACKDPTEIVVDVRTDDCEGVRDTGIAVGASLAAVEGAEPTAFNGHDKCESSDRLGTLTIYPSKAKDDTVAFKVVTGVKSPAAQCVRNNDYGCIVQKREARFVPGASQRIVVRMSVKCLDRVCPDGFSCDEGLCVPTRDIDNSGKVNPDASFVEAGSLADAAGGCDPAKCTGGVTHGCDAGVCVVTCDDMHPCNGNACAGDQDCAINCISRNGCANVDCQTAGKCTILCAANDSCAQVTCAAAECDLDCKGEHSCEVARVDAGQAVVTCEKAEDKQACNNLRCNGSCALTCIANNNCDTGDQLCCSTTCAGPWDTKPCN